MAAEESSNKTLNFHNAAMRWKCSLLNEEQLLDMEEWIATKVSEKMEDISKPWTAGSGEDELSKENEYIQAYVFLSLSVMDQTDAEHQIYRRPPCYDRQGTGTDRTVNWDEGHYTHWWTGPCRGW